MSASPSAIQRIDEAGQQRFPGLILWTAQNGVTGEWPPDADLNWPAGLPVNSGGIAARQGRYYAWTDIVEGNRQVLALTPLTRRFLSLLMRGLGDVYFVRRDFGASTDTARTGTDQKDADREVFRPAGGDAPQAAVPPPVNRFDVPVRWGSFMRAVVGCPDRRHRIGAITLATPVCLRFARF